MAGKDRPPLCRYWLPQLQSGCRFGDRCRYAHPAPSHHPCRFFAKGDCRDGDKCLFAHGSKGKGKGHSTAGPADSDSPKSKGKGKGKDDSAGEPVVDAKAHERITKLFRKFDDNGDGFIQSEELTRIFRMLDPGWDADQIGLLLTAADTNGDGRIDYDEFVRWVLARDDEWSAAREDIREYCRGAMGSDSGEAIELTISDLSDPHDKKYKVTANSAWTVKRLRVAACAVSGIPLQDLDLAARWDDLDEAELLGGGSLDGVSEYQLLDRRLLDVFLGEADLERLPDSAPPGSSLRQRYFYGVDVTDLF